MTEDRRAQAPEPAPEYLLSEELLLRIKQNVEQMLLGKIPPPLEETPDQPQLAEVIELMNMLAGNLGEMAEFSRAVAKGSLDIIPPNRRNFLASPLKELHSQLSSFVWIAQQVQKGRIVDKLDYMGEISTVLNGLIDTIASINAREGSLSDAAGLSCSMEDAPNANAVSSWKYHQVLLAFQHLQQMVLLVDQNGHVVFANRSAQKHFLTMPILRAQYYDPDSTALEQSLIQASASDVKYPCFQEIAETDDNIWYKIITDQISYPDGSLLYLHTIEDITEWKLNETELRLSATTDQLTTVFNRAIGLKALDEAVENKDTLPSCAAFIDVDRLKHINDNYGHNEGDYAIQTIAELLSSSVRDTDTVSRFGGDEFLVIFTGCKYDMAERIITRVQKKLHDMNQSHVKPYSLSFSFGVTQIDENCSANAKEIIMLTDKKMYERKKKDRVASEQ